MCCIIVDHSMSDNYSTLFVDEDWSVKWDHEIVNYTNDNDNDNNNNDDDDDDSEYGNPIIYYSCSQPSK